MQTLIQDLRYGFRTLRKNPGFAIVAVLTLAFGIGANTAIFSAVNAVLLRPLPFADEDRLVVMWKHDQTSSHPLVELSIAEFNDWRRESGSFESLAAMPTSVYGYGYVMTGRGEPVQIESSRVSADFFKTLGVSPSLGRAFTAEDDHPGAGEAVIISHRLWRDYFGADEKVIGQAITLNETPFQIVGVMTADFEFPKGVDIWSPLSASVGGGALQNREAVFLQAVGRLKAGVSREKAEAEMNAVIGRVAAAHPETEAEGHRVVITPVPEYLFGSARPALWLLLAATGLLLLIACANVASLLLARATARRKEMAVRAALGASRFRIVRQLFVESLTLAGAGGALGVLFAYWLADLLVVVAPADIPRVENVRVDAVVLLFSTAATLLTSALFGLAPALSATKMNLTAALGDGGRTAGERHGNRLRAALVVGEIAVTLVLLAGAGLALRSFVKLQQVDTGFDTENVLTFQLRLFGKKYPDAKSVRDFYQQLTERLEAQPGVTAAGAVLIRPLEGVIGWDVPFATADQSPDDAKRNRVPNFEVVTPHYFRSVGLPLLAGREFTERDDDDAPKVAIISEAMARGLFAPGLDPLGQRLRLFDPSDPDTEWHTVVGVVGDARYREVRDARWDVYVPYRQFAFPVRYVTVRATSDPAALAATVRREVAALDSQQAVTSVKTTGQLFAENVARPRFNSLLLTLLASLAALLAGLGIYGVISYSVAQRTREIGVRIALGAQQGDVLRLVFRQGLKLILSGIVIGLVAAFLLSRLMESLLFGISATDPLTFVVVSLLLVVVALVACYVPARRAMRVDPMVALRYE